MNNANIEIEIPNINVKKADAAWLFLAAYVAAYDVYAIYRGRETLSSAFWRALTHPKVKFPTALIATGLYKHLMFPDFLPELDPLNQFAKLLRKTK